MYVKAVDLPGTIIASTKEDESSGQSATPYAIYDGGFPDAQRGGICIRIANGGAGQSGLIKAWADAFIQDMVSHGSEPFQVIKIYLVK